jgi:kumamolisin
VVKYPHKPKVEVQMASQSYVTFKDSHRTVPAGTRGSQVAASEPIEISLYLKAKPGPAPTAGGETREHLAQRRVTEHQDDIARIEEFAREAGLTVVSVEPARRLIKLSGPASKMEAAFHTKLSHYEHAGHKFRGRSGTLSLPADLEPLVEAVLGLDTRPAASPRFRPRQAATSPNFPPNQVAGFYGFPASVTGAGQCIALIELGGGYTDADNQAAFSAMGLATPTVIAVPVDGGKNGTDPNDNANGEVALDIQVAGGAAPGATIAVYFTPNTDAGFVDAVTAAAHDTTNKPSIISISWGGPESGWSAQSLSAMTSALQDAATMNVSVFVAAGDNLATDGQTDGKAHVDFPASSPWAIGCGGTLITVQNDAITNETVWNEGNSGTGGGISDVYPVPGFQTNASLPVSVNTGNPGRGVPDVAGNADPNSGYSIVVGGQTQVVGGTSAVAPLWAGLTALINQQVGAPIGFFLPTLYNNPSLCRGITTGNNIPEGSTIGYAAGPGWNACTGLGAPIGAALAAGLAPAPAAPAPAPAPVS